MKHFAKTLMTYINQVHSYPFWLFIFFLYASIFTFGICALFCWFPQTISNIDKTVVTGELLFECGLGLFTIGCITAPIMDIILHVDIDGR